MKSYTLTAQFQDDDHAWLVTIGSYKTIAEAEKAGYAIIKKYDTAFPRVGFFRIEEAN